MNFLLLSLKRVRTRSPVSLLKRIFSVGKRYGLNKTRFSSYLEDFVKMSSEIGIRPTFPVPGVVVKENRDFLKRMEDSGADFAAHGLVHIDYSMVNDDTFMHHLSEINEIFIKSGIKCRGFRFPFFRKKSGYGSALIQAGFDWDSSEVVSFPINNEWFNKSGMKNYNRIKKTYEPKNYGHLTHAPELSGGIVEIPASIPDDDILIERLGLKEHDNRWRVWSDMLARVRKDGSFIILQAHPERFLEFKRPLRNFIEEVKSCNDVWITSMNELADWWKERRKFKVLIQKEGRSRYRVNIVGTSKTTILVKNLITFRKDVLYSPVYSPVKEKSFVIKCNKKPIIGIFPDVHGGIKIFLTDEGFIWEESQKEKNYSLFIKGKQEFGEEAKLSILHSIDMCPYQLIRIWRWPKEKSAAFVLTGDIDGVTMWDIWMRNYGKRK